MKFLLLSLTVAVCALAAAKAHDPPSPLQTEAPSPNPNPNPDPQPKPQPDPEPQPEPEPEPKPDPSNGGKRFAPEVRAGNDGTIILKAHNQYRSDHGVPPLEYDNQIARFAQNYCDGMAATGKLKHSGAKGLGENLYYGTGSLGTAQNAVDSWYNEIRYYTDYQNGGFSKKTGHFTQLVWKSSRLIGCGISENGDAKFFCCNYYPAGNVQGRYQQNVFPPKK